MAKLHFSLEANSLGEFALDKERMTIGRRPTNDIHIDNLAVSGEHAVIVTIGNDSFLEDLNSTNGTLVNGKPIKKHVLSHGDVIKFGKYQLTYENKIQQKAPPTQGFENTVVVRPAKLAVTPSDIPEKTQTSEAVITAEKPELATTPPEEKKLAGLLKENLPQNAKTQAQPATSDVPKSGFLEVLSGENAGNNLTLNKAMTTLGNPATEVAVITKRPHGYFITHVSGSHQPIVNGQSIGAQAHALSDQDVIEVSGIKMKFFIN
jgi:pSer/pThr/pTyr-binding forkhead associated (FHA) protein